MVADVAPDSTTSIVDVVENLATARGSLRMTWRGAAHGAQQDDEGVRQARVQRGGTDLEHRVGVVEDLGGGGEQPDAGVVAPPAGLVVELRRLGPHAGPADHLGDGVVAAWART